ncbi:MAG: SpoIIE family protein phosphatase [Verrucomicrobiota bacterium]
MSEQGGQDNRIDVLLKVARELSSAMDLNALLSEILISSQQVMRAEAGSIFLPAPDTGELIIHSASGDKAPLLNATRIPKGMGVAGAVFENKESINITDPKNDPRHYGKVDEKTGFQTKAMITAPLLSGDSCVGVVQVLNPIDRDFFNEDDLQFFEGFAGLIAAALIRLEAQNRELAAQKAQQELELAKEIQQSFLPAEFKVFPTCQARMVYSPAREVGGDFCFIHPLEGDRILCGLGDVTGKGIPAALTMARATAEIKGMCAQLENDGLGKWVSELNNHLAEELSGGRFIGITFLLADNSRKEISVCNAGQYSPLVFNGRGWRLLECPPQLPLGIMEGYEYSQLSYPLEAGNLWMLFSDGITEARNPQGEEYTEERLISDCPSCANAKTALETINKTWITFMDGTPQHDDASLLMLDWRGTKPPPTFCMECTPENLCGSREYIERWAKFCGFDDITVGQIVLACDEATTNVYRYAYEGKGGPITYEIHFKDGEFIQITLIDQGIPADPEKIKGRKLEDLRPGGLGTVLLQQVFDHVEYIPQSIGTHLVLKKQLSC